ncbi:PIN domain-containing protein [Candidatus Pacearchaeota archaeon]|nr:PIN domain-containing protein [Candidatus Pacearchaeota archaeon]
MKIVLDTSIAYFLFSKDSFIRKFIVENKLSLFSVDELLEELSRESAKICKITNRSFEEVSEMLDLFPLIINFKPVKKEFFEKAESLISHKNDAPFLALALELNIPIWSNDKHFKEQSLTRVFTTEELKKYFSEKSLSEE